MKSISEALMWRYATKQFDTTKKVSDEAINEILEAGRLSPSSYGLQPWKFILIENPELRTKLREAAYNQSQLTDASHIVVVAHRTTMDESYIDTYMQSIADTRGMDVKDLEGFKNAILGSIAGKGEADIKAWNARQSYLPLGIMLETAALLEVDACPMEGFDSSKFDEILELSGTEYASVAILSLGYRSTEDATANYPKSRFPAEEVIIRK